MYIPFIFIINGLVNELSFSLETVSVHMVSEFSCAINDIGSHTDVISVCVCVSTVHVLVLVSAVLLLILMLFFTVALKSKVSALKLSVMAGILNAEA